MPDGPNTEGEGGQMSDGYSLFKSGGGCYCRWSEWHDGKRTQPSHRLGNVRDFPQKKEAKALAAEYISAVRRAQTPEAGASVREFVTGVFFPALEKRVAKNTRAFYRRTWKQLEPHLGRIRLRDVREADVQAALHAIHGKRDDELCHDAYLQLKVTCGAIFSHALRLGHHPGPNPETAAVLETTATTIIVRMVHTACSRLSSSFRCFPAGRTPSWRYGSLNSRHYCRMALTETMSASIAIQKRATMNACR